MIDRITALRDFTNGSQNISYTAEQTLDKVLEIMGEYPEAQAVGVEGFITLPDAEHLTASQVDTMTSLLHYWQLRINRHDLVPYGSVKTGIRQYTPWLAPHMPDWFKEEEASSKMTPGAFVTLMAHFNEVSFKYPGLKAGYLLSKENSVQRSIARSSHGLDAKVITMSGETKINLRLMGHGTTLVIDKVTGEKSWELYLSRNEIPHPARGAFPRKAITVRISNSDESGVVITSSSDVVSIIPLDTSLVVE